MASDYSVIGQRHTTIIDPAGNLSQVMEVTYQTTNGTVGHVDVPLSTYSEATVRAAIEPLVEQINKVANL